MAVLKSQSAVRMGGILAGVVYGLLSRILFGSAKSGMSAPLDGIFFVMSIAFVFLMPIALGGWVVAAVPPERRSWRFAIFGPWAACGIALLTALLIHLEGAICVVFMAPSMAFCATIGGVTMHIILRQTRRSTRSLAVAAFGVLPYAVAPIEALISLPSEMRTVRNEIEIAAPPAVVWQQVKSVRTIEPHELPWSWVYAIGFPKPVAATISHDGIGGVRVATFAGNLRFTETVDMWDEPRRLSFAIKVDPVPRTTLDEHVTIGGPFFDVLRGTYELFPSALGTRVVLWSEQRLSTHYNRYAALWTEGVMRDIQATILEVIKNRSEAHAHLGALEHRSSEPLTAFLGFEKYFDGPIRLVY